ncbi:hypothetical protein Hanom_Chr14g01270621 [Helianthus anomalus]
MFNFTNRLVTNYLYELNLNRCYSIQIITCYALLAGTLIAAFRKPPHFEFKIGVRDHKKRKKQKTFQINNVFL